MSHARLDDSSTPSGSDGRSLSVALAYWLGRLVPAKLDLENHTDCYFFLSDRMRAAPEDVRRERLLASAEWRYQYEHRNHTLDYMFAHPLEPVLSGKTVLDFGCFLGGTTIAWMEQYGISRALGFDTEPVFADGANLFARTKRANAEFTAAYGEQLPYDANSVDAIIAVDVFEHVKDVGRCLSECSRVLRTGGHLLAIFPPFFNPIAHHMKVSNTPFLHWLFSGETLRKMQNAVFSEYGSDAKHFMIRALDGYRSPYLNGVTVHAFQRLVRQGPWKIVLDRRRGFPSMGQAARSSRLARAISLMSTPMAHLPLLDEVTLDHVAVILQKT